MDMDQRSTPAVIALGEPGDLSAPPGSRAWAIAVRAEIEGCLHNNEKSAARLSWLIQTMEAHEGYKQLADVHGRPFASYRDFCEARQPWGLGYSPHVITRIVKERQTAQARAERPKNLLDDGPATQDERYNFDYIKDNPGGTSADYLTARIARDRPDILERMKAGDYTSVRKAAIAAGITKPRISIPTDPAGATRAILRHFTPSQVAELIELLREASQ